MRILISAKKKKKNCGIRKNEEFLVKRSSHCIKELYLGIYFMTFEFIFKIMIFVMPAKISSKMKLSKKYTKNSDRCEHFPVMLFLTVVKMSTHGVFYRVLRSTYIYNVVLD